MQLNTTTKKSIDGWKRISYSGQPRSLFWFSYFKQYLLSKYNTYMYVHTNNSTRCKQTSAYARILIIIDEYNSNSADTVYKA